MGATVSEAAQDSLDPLSAKRWLRLAPMVFVTFSLAHLDRVNYAFAAAAGINKDLNISQETSSLVGAMFFLGYFLFQIPGTLYAQRQGAKRLIGICLVLWGAFATLTGVVTSIPMLMMMRFCLGAVEAAVLPSLLVLINNWFVRSERSKANTMLLLGNPITMLWMSVLSGYLVAGYGWRVMFIVEGLPAIAWALVWWLVVADKPSDARWLSKAEQDRITEALEREQQGLAPVRNYGDAFRSPRVLALCATYFFWNLGIFGFLLWLPSIVKAASGSGMVATGWLSAAPFLLAIIAMLSVSYGSDRLKTRRHFVWPCLAIASVCFLALYGLSSLPFWATYGLLVVAGASLLAPMAPFLAMPPEFLPKSVAAGATALINSMGALGGFAGAYLVGLLTGMTGDTAAAYLLMGLSLLSAVAVLLSLRTVEAGPSNAASANG
jgi:sugar phosphate permease